MILESAVFSVEIARQNRVELTATRATIPLRKFEKHAFSISIGFAGGIGFETTDIVGGEERI